MQNNPMQESIRELYKLNREILIESHTLNGKMMRAAQILSDISEDVIDYYYSAEELAYQCGVKDINKDDLLINSVIR